MGISAEPSSMSAQSMEGGFTDPVYNAQAVFSAIMNAMARPGTIGQVNVTAQAPSPINKTVAAIVQTLCDADTPIWFDLGQNSESAKSFQDWVLFQTSAKPSDHHAQAMFAIIVNAASMPSLAEFAQGSQEYPDRSTTLIIQVASLSDGTALALSGPGIKETTSVSIDGLPSNFIDQWAHNNARFPRGVDVIFASENEFLCLPRTTKIQEEAV